MSIPDRPGALRHRVIRFARREVVPFLTIVLVLMTFRSAVADWYDVPTGSMRPTIIEGDRILVNKLAYDLRFPFTNWRIAAWDQPERGEVVIFPSPKDGTRLVKRVIGVPGDTVELRNNVLLINGEQARERMQGGREHAVAAVPASIARRNFGPVTVPPEMYLTLGDNRDESADSRFFGFVPRGSIVGRSTRIAISLDYSRWLLPRWSRFGQSLD